MNLHQCTNCGSVVSGDTCPACGAPIALPEAEAGSQEAPPMSAPPPGISYTAQPILGGTPPLYNAPTTAADPPAVVLSMKPRSSTRKKAMVTTAAVAFIATLGMAIWLLVLRPDTQDQYLKALADAGLRSDFQTDRAAVLHAESTCKSFDGTGEPRGGKPEQIAVDFYCPRWSDDFRLLETVTVTGHFSVSDIDEYYSSNEGSFCEGEGGYSDITSSTQVILSNGSGDILTRTNLGLGHIDDYTCEYSFSLKVSEGEESYVLAVGRRGENTYSFEDLKDGVNLGLG